MRGLTAARRVWGRLIGRSPFLVFASPGHFYSPIPDMGFIDRHKGRLFDRTAVDIPGIDNNVAAQLALVEAFAKFEMPFKEQKDGLRYYFANPYFGHPDAIALYAMLRHYKPQRVIEVGSGFSSALMLDTNELFLSESICFTFIEPFPERLRSLLRTGDSHLIIEDMVQNVPWETFGALQANDILFIDSSHVGKIGSDVTYLLTDVLPRLNPGVLVHFHDVFWPFEYPEEWLREGRAWNELYLLKAFLQFNSAFKILLFNSYLGIHHASTLERHLPGFMKSAGGSLWLQKV